MISAVSIDGTPLDLGRIEYQVTIQTGSSAQWESPQSTSCQLRVWSPDIVPASVGQELVIEDDDIPTGKARFRGQVTNIELMHPTDGAVRATITAQAPLMRLGRATTGYWTAPEQTAAQRITDICTEAGVTAIIKRDDQTALVGREFQDTACRFAFDECLASEPFDVWEMNIPLQLRTGPQFDLCRFDDSDPQADTTAVFTDGASETGLAIELWSENRRDEDAAITLPPDAVVWEPVWRQDTGRVINAVSVTYGDHPAPGTSTPRPVVRVADDPSAAIYGPASTQVTTDLKDAADAGHLATRLLTTYSAAHWEAASCDVVMDSLDTVTRKLFMTRIRPGAKVSMTNLPQPAPAFASEFYVEGFTESYANGQHIITLALTAIPTGPQFDLMRFDDADPNSPTTAVFNY